jgi:hypothetical protein
MLTSDDFSTAVTGMAVEGRRARGLVAERVGRLEAAPAGDLPA